MKLLFLTVILLFQFNNGHSKEAKIAGYFGIIDLKIMEEKKYDSNRDKSIIGYIIPQEIFASRTECESNLIGAYAGSTWEIEKTKNPHRKGELKLHTYKTRWNGKEVEKVTDQVRFCIRLIKP